MEFWIHKCECSEEVLIKHSIQECRITDVVPVFVDESKIAEVGIHWCNLYSHNGYTDWGDTRYIPKWEIVSWLLVECGFPEVRKNACTGVQAFRVGSHRYCWYLCRVCGEQIPNEWDNSSSVCSFACFIEAEKPTLNYNCTQCHELVSGLSWEELQREYFPTHFIRGKAVTKGYYKAAHRWEPLIDKILDRIGFTKERLTLRQTLFCSRSCCFLALRDVLQKEKEILSLERDKKCVRELKKLMPKLRKSLREVDPEAWSMLKKEFERVATLRE